MIGTIKRSNVLKHTNKILSFLYTNMGFLLCYFNALIFIYNANED